MPNIVITMPIRPRTKLDIYTIPRQIQIPMSQTDLKVCWPFNRYDKIRLMVDVILPLMKSSTVALIDLETRKWYLQQMLICILNL